MNGQRERSRTGARFALWGSSDDLDAQFRTCQRALDGSGSIVRSFREGASPTGAQRAVAVRDAGLAPVCEGGWAQLAEAVRDPARDFDAVVCDRIERLSRRLDVFSQRHALCAENGVPIVSVDRLPDYLPHPVMVRLFHQVQAALAEYEQAMHIRARQVRVSRDL